jgi:hypothetical protein
MWIMYRDLSTYLLNFLAPTKLLNLNVKFSDILFAIGPDDTDDTSSGTLKIN